VFFKVEYSKVIYQFIKHSKELLHGGRSCLPLACALQADKLRLPLFSLVSQQCAFGDCYV